jgi:hypothetical protein
MDFNSLLVSNTRSDEFVNATKLCQAFGKRFSEYKRLPETRRFLEAIYRKCENPTISKRGVGTWVHPLVAIHLAEWLSPEFSVYVKETFRKFIEGDTELAKDIIGRQTDVDKVQDVVEYTKEHREYLRTHISVNYEIAKTKDQYLEARYHGNVNDNMGIKDGTRPAHFKVKPNDKPIVSAMNAIAARRMNNYRKSVDNLDAQVSKGLAYNTVKQVKEMIGEEYIKPRDNYLPKTVRKYLED